MSNTNIIISLLIFVIFFLGVILGMGAGLLNWFVGWV